MTIVLDHQQIRYKEARLHEMVISVDLAKSVDLSTYAVCEAMPKATTNARGKNMTMMTLKVVNLQQIPQGTDYVDVARIIHDVYYDQRTWLQTKVTHRPIAPTLLVDAGGVGHGVCDTIQRYMGLRPVRYKLVRGTSRVTRHDRFNWTVPRPLLFSLLDGAFGSDRFAVDPRLKLAKTLIDELGNLQLEMNEETGSVRVTHREGTHDDLAIAVGAANWWAHQPERPRPYMLLDGRPPQPGLADRIWR
jgi:hypothetical protein